MVNTGAADAGGAAGEGTSNSGPSSSTPATSPISTTKTTTNTPTTGVANKQTSGGILKNTTKPTHEALSKQVDKNFEGATPEVGGVVALCLEHHVLQRITFELFQ